MLYILVHSAKFTLKYVTPVSEKAVFVYLETDIGTVKYESIRSKQMVFIKNSYYFMFREHNMLNALYILWFSCLLFLKYDLDIKYKAWENSDDNWANIKPS